MTRGGAGDVGVEKGRRQEEEADFEIQRGEEKHVIERVDRVWREGPELAPNPPHPPAQHLYG